MDSETYEEISLMELDNIQYYFVMVLAGIPFLISMSNLGSLGSLRGSGDGLNEAHSSVLVSVLVPARNEEDGIIECLQALSEQTHASLEIIILDDRSTDCTAEIIKSVVDSDPRMRMVRGMELPSGWHGKHWACEQLAGEATGEFLLFVDADTILSAETVSDALYESKHSNADLLTVMPRRTANCITERLMFPLMDWLLFCWMPIRVAHKRRIPNLSSTFGQFMLFKRESYLSIGGHSRIRGNPLDDFNLGRTIKKIGLKWVLLEGLNCVEVLAYKGNVDAFKGVSRSIFPAINYRVSVFILFSIALLGVGLLPLFTLVWTSTSASQKDGLMLMSAMSLSMVIISWLIVCLKFKHSALIILVYPLSILVIFLAACHSLVTHGFGFTNWKGRRMMGHRIRF